MKIRFLLRALMACLAFGPLSSCVYDGYPYDGGSYYDDYDYGYGPQYYGSAGVWSSYRHGRGYYHSGRYYQACQVCHHHPCRCRHRDNDRDRHRHRVVHRRSHDHDDDDGEKMRLVRYREGDRRRLPQGYHSADWYKKHGISTSRNTFRERSGETRGREISRSRDRDDRPRSRGDRDSKSDRKDKDKRSKHD
ncbi:MAG: hypothetical protein ACR2OZ_14525 [Verrucomicrobiales bacterium]